MKKIIIVFALLLMSVNSYSSCRRDYQYKINDMNYMGKDLMITTFGTPFIIFSIATYLPVGVGALTVVGSWLGGRAIKKGRLKRMVKFIDQAYNYKSNGTKGRIL